MPPAMSTNESPHLDSKQGDLRALLIAMLVLPTVIIIVRFWSRYLFVTSPTTSLPIRFWWDDWTALAAAILNIVVCTVGLKLVSLGMGLHIDVVPPENIEPFLKYLWAEYFLFDAGTAVAKTSALFFYARIFGAAAPKFRYALWVLHAMNAAWLAGILFAVIFECNPIEKAWKPAIPGTCVNTQTLWAGSGITSLLIDVLILLVPLPMLWKLHIKWVRKLQIIGVFVCGYLVVVVSIGRLVTIVQTGTSLQLDPTYKIATPVLWLGSEIAISITSVSLPSILFLVQRVWREGPASLFSPRYSSSSSSKPGDFTASRGRHHVGDESYAELDTRPFKNMESFPGNSSFNSHGEAVEATEEARWNDGNDHVIHVRQDVIVS